VTRHEPPETVVAAARARAAARAARDWPRADALKAEIEVAGWKVIDRGTDFRLQPASPPTVEEGGIVRYGAAVDVPSALDEPPSAAFTVLVVAGDAPDDLVRLIAGLRAHAPAGTHVVIVANHPTPEQDARLAPDAPDLAAVAGEPPEVVRTSVRLGRAAARNVGLRRVRGEIVVLAEPAVEPLGDALSPFAVALADASIAVAGAVGLVTADFRRYEEAPGADPDVVGLEWLAFRRTDLVALGPLDEKLVTDDHLGAWWSLVLRAGADPDVAPRGARRLDLPLALHGRERPSGPVDA